MYTRGMGTGEGQATVGVIGATTGAVLPSVLASQGIIGTVAAGSLAVPLIGAGIAAVTAVIGIFMARNAQYHAQETATTHIVDDAEKLMEQNLAAWQGSNKTASDQAQAIQNFNDIWGQVVAACSQQQFGDPGQRCIHDRERGGPWPWPEWYLDPIAEDPNVQPDPVQGVVSGVESAFQNVVGSGSNIPLLLAAGIALWVLAS